MITLFQDRPEFVNRKGEQLYYVAHGKDRLSCWEVLKSNAFQTECRLRIIPIAAVSQAELRDIEIWEELDPAIKETICKIEAGEELEELKEQLPGVTKEQKDEEKAKRRRKKDQFKSYPESLECACGNKTKANYSYLSQKADKMGIDIKELIDGYQCQICNPTKGRGRTPNPEFDGLPDSLECKCGNKTKANYSQLTKKANKLSVTLQQLIDGYQCQSCNPTKGRKKKQKK